MNEKISALLDGDAATVSAGSVFEALRDSPELLERWNTYCLIGDALRGDHPAHAVPGFVATVMSRLEAEPTVLAPPPKRAAPSFLGRSLMPIAASVMGVAAVGLVAFTLYPKTPDAVPVAAGTLASQTAVQPVAAIAGAPVVTTVASDDSHRHYMFVHQAMSGGGPIPGGVHYVRTVSDARGDQR